MRYRFIDEHRTVWPIAVQCDVLEVARSGYYAWRKRPPSSQAQRRAELTDRIQEIHARKNHDVYGDRKSTRLNSSHIQKSRMPSSA